jgi:hypothetical protein
MIGVAMMKRVRFCSIITLALVLLAACGQDESQDIAYTNIHIHFAPSAPHQNVTKVMVYISIHDGEDIERELDIDGDGRRATGAVAVPIGELITIRVEAYEGGEVTHTGSEEVYIYEAGEIVSVDIYLGSGGGGGGDIYNIDIVGLRNGQRVSERTQIISGVIPESIAPNVDHGRIHLVNQQTGGSDESRLMNVGSSGSFAQ